RNHPARCWRVSPLWGSLPRDRRYSLVPCGDWLLRTASVRSSLYAIDPLSSPSLVRQSNCWNRSRVSSEDKILLRLHDLFFFWLPGRLVSRPTGLYWGVRRKALIG